MFGIPGLGQVLMLLSGAGWFWKILRNWGLISTLIKDFESVFVDMLTRQTTLPSCDDVKKLTNAVNVLFEADLISIPGVDSSSIERVLSNVENNLVCHVQNAERLNNGPK